MPLPIEEILTELIDSEEPLANSWLVELSHLTPEETSLLEKTWPEVEPGRRRQLITLLAELAEANPKLDFNSIFRSRLGDQDDEVRSKAIEGLWESEDTSLINTFIDLLEQDSSEAVQVAAAQTLGQFALMAEFDRLRADYKSRIGQTLRGVFNDEARSVAVRRRALESLAPLSLPETNPTIERAYYDADPKLKTSAIYAMGKTCDPAWLDILLTEMASNEAEARYEIAQACGEIGGMEAVPLLTELIDDPDAEVQLAAIQALGKIGGAEAKECLEECLDNPNDAITEAARAALDELTSDENPFSLRF
jgi:HEAT repeat protein